MWKLVARFPKWSAFRMVPVQVCLPVCAGLIERCAQVVFDAFAELSGRYSGGQMRGGGRKNVASMKCSAHRVQKIFLGGDVADLRFLPSEDHRKHAVVGSDEVLPGHLG